MNVFLKLSLTMVFALSSMAMTSVPAAAGAATDGSTDASAASNSDAASSMSEGEIKRVDKDAGKLTIKHGELKNLSMPPMTMVFRVKDPAMLESVKAGDKVSFVAEKIGGQFTVTHLEARQ